MAAPAGDACCSTPGGGGGGAAHAGASRTTLAWWPGTAARTPALQIEGAWARSLCCAPCKLTRPGRDDAARPVARALEVLGARLAGARAGQRLWGVLAGWAGFTHLGRGVLGVARGTDCACCGVGSCVIGSSWESDGCGAVLATRRLDCGGVAGAARASVSSAVPCVGARLAAGAHRTAARWLTGVAVLVERAHGVPIVRLEAPA